MPEEEEAFLDFLEGTGAIVAYPDHWVRSEVEVSPSPLRSYLAAHDPVQLDLGLEAHVEDVTIENQWKSDEQFFYLSTIRSCLIGYSRPCFRNGNQLGQSNLAAYLDFLKDGALQLKPDWFQSWVKQVFTWAKKHAKKKCAHQGFSYPATPLVLKLVEEKQIEVVH
jgi:hypothetical protein